MFQIANLKATLAKKEGDRENVQHRVSGSPGGKLSPRSPSNLQQVDSYDEPKNHRKLRADVRNAEKIWDEVGESDEEREKMHAKLEFSTLLASLG
ncbi:hypothetical protein L1987_80644 [Smallanthus sonchifolius]|uniref:Uncharacterized protein n=1 Tax=Smallanthus sonchifolius TaxID=185202 RepID=A0ACB8YMI3_9ASTR|nr:hypothetical protein L1987_80644 [Smallanthus sonchifolius]